MSAQTVDTKIIAFQNKLLQDAMGFMKAQVLFTASEVGVFKAIGNDCYSVDKLSAQIHMPSKTIKRLCDSAVACGYLTKDADGRYENTDAVEAVLSKEAPGFLGNYFSLMKRWYDSFSYLEKSIRTNCSIENINDTNDKTYTKKFIKGLVDFASYRGSGIADNVALDQYNTLVDVGGGAGIYSILFCNVFQHLHCSIVDLPEVLKIAEESVTEHNLQDRITLIPQDYKDGNWYCQKYDAILMSHILHQETEQTNLNLIKKAYDCLNPDGILIIQSMFPNDNLTGPLYPMLHDLLCLLVFPGGKNYTRETMKNWLLQVGFSDITETDLSFFNFN
jgi:ubiquinone/menaquinone biosynthesis C-methylase UbiE